MLAFRWSINPKLGKDDYFYLNHLLDGVLILLDQLNLLEIHMKYILVATYHATKWLKDKALVPTLL
jgi:hypothetical protein